MSCWKQCFYYFFFSTSPSITA